MAPFSTDVTAGTNGTATQYNNLRKDLILGVLQTGADADGTTITFDLSDKTKGKLRSVTLGGNRTLAISNPRTDQSFILILTQDGTGARTVTWWSNIKWVNTSPPILTTTAARADMFAFYYDGTYYYGSVVGQNYG